LNKNKGADTVQNFIREKRIYCGNNYLEIDIYPCTETKQKGKRNKKQNVTAQKQRNLNDKNAKRYFIQLGNTNFGKDDLQVTLTYTEENRPNTPEEAKKQVDNFLRRVEYKRKKEGLPALKYLAVLEMSDPDEEKAKKGKLHHHIIMNGGLDRDTVESLWVKKKEKGQKEAEKLGWANADRLQPDEYGIEAICRYISKDPKGKKRWSQSKNLQKPCFINNDAKYSRRKVEKMAKCPDDRMEWEKLYTGYLFTECKPVYNENTGWSVHLKMRRRC